jgi:hypothetical protein
MKKHFGLVFLTAAIICGQAWAQAPDTAWVRAYNGPAGGDDQGIGCTIDDSGHLYVSGTSSNGSDYDFLTIKYDAATGDTLWTRRYNGPANGMDCGMRCAVDGEGNLYVSGYSLHGAPYDSSDYLTIKYNPAGDTVWARTYNSPANDADFGYGCAVDAAGYCYVAGASYFGNGTADYVTVKYDATTGDTLWTRRYNGPANGSDKAFDCSVDGSGNVYVCGYSFNGTDYNLLTVKYNPDGDTVWTRRSADATDSANMDYAMAGCAVDGSGNVYITGECGPRTGNRYSVTIKYNASGTPLWTGIYDGPSMMDGTIDCAVNGPGDRLYVTGSTYRGPHDHYLTVCYDASIGDTLWSRSYLSSDDRTEYSIGCAVDGDGNLYVSGVSLDTLTWIGDYQTIKYNTATGVAGEPAERTAWQTVKLLPNRPNPFSQHTTINYQLAGTGRVSLAVYNIAGQKVKTLADGPQNAGTHSMRWDGRDEKGNRVCAGVYFSCLLVGVQQATSKITIVR